MTLHSNKSKNRNTLIIKILHINAPLSSKDDITSSRILHSRLRIYLSVEFSSRKILNLNPQQMKIKHMWHQLWYVYRCVNSILQHFFLPYILKRSYYSILIKYCWFVFIMYLMSIFCQFNTDLCCVITKIIIHYRYMLRIIISYGEVLRNMEL
jgi:hypothetical protein